MHFLIWIVGISKCKLAQLWLNGDQLKPVSLLIRLFIVYPVLKKFCLTKTYFRGLSKWSISISRAHAMYFDYYIILCLEKIYQEQILTSFIQYLSKKEKWINVFRLVKLWVISFLLSEARSASIFFYNSVKFLDMENYCDKSLQSPPFPHHTQTTDSFTERLTHYIHAQMHVRI